MFSVCVCLHKSHYVWERDSFSSFSFEYMHRLLGVYVCVWVCVCVSLCVCMFRCVCVFVCVHNFQRQTVSKLHTLLIKIDTVLYSELSEPCILGCLSGSECHHLCPSSSILRPLRSKSNSQISSSSSQQVRPHQSINDLFLHSLHHSAFTSLHDVEAISLYQVFNRL